MEPGTIIQYTTPERNNALGMVMAKEAFFHAFEKERGHWPTGKTYTSALQIAFGYNLPARNEFAELSLLEQSLQPCGNTAKKRIIEPASAFFKQDNLIGVRNIEGLESKLYKLHEIVPVVSCKPVAINIVGSRT